MARDQGARAASRERDGCCCVGCGRVPANPIERAEVAMTWLLPGADGAAEPVERHFCRGCAPTGRVADVVCVRCGDGPLLAGDLAGDDEQGPPPAPVRGWLSAAGWALSGPICPGCVGELSR